LLVSTPAMADELSEPMSAYLAAGEFGPALELANLVKDRDQRDQWLGRIARAQADIGAREASISTLMDIHSDLARSRAAGDIGDRMIGGAGGAAMADFDTLIELITATIAPNTWDDVGGAGAIEPFPTGVYVDASGVMKRLAPRRTHALMSKARDAARADSGNRDVTRTSHLRKVSLVRLERNAQLLKAFGDQPTESMQLLAGIYKIKYLFVYPEQGDIVVAGPASDWQRDREGRIVSVDSGRPVLHLDDFVTVLRNAYQQHGRMGCAIKPRQENLAAAQAFLNSSAGKPIRASRRDQWVENLRSALGKQDIEVWGIDARTQTARILIEADYHMKLIGMGLEEGTLGVVSYLDALKDAAGDKDVPMDVLRWWFTLDYDSAKTNPDRNIFQLDGQGVRVLSENELLTETGERIHTHKSKVLNTEFARSFTKHFDALAAKYPIYAELSNTFDMALICALLQAEDIPEKVDWHMTHFCKPEAYQLTLGPMPREIESIVNVVDISQTRFLTGVSGGVAIDTTRLVTPEFIKTDDYGLLDAARGSATPDLQKLPADVWWWD
jgi:truncated hemoglobin YjbI